MQLICDICQENCRIPVQFTCFPCYKHNNIHCHSMKRFCLICAEKFLHSENNKKKCIYCRQSTKINKNMTLYIKDFLYMSNDIFDHYKCFYCNWTGNQLDLNRHLQHCPESLIECTECKKTIKKKNMNDHKQNCDWFYKCNFCHEYIEYYKYQSHLQRLHDAKFCIYCNDIFLNIHISDHITHECKFRPIQCKYCITVYDAIDEKKHLKSHLESMKKHMNSSFNQYNNIKHQYQILKKEINNL